MIFPLFIETIKINTGFVMTEIQFNNKLINSKNHLHNYAFGLTSDREKANDLVQETMLKALTNRDKFQEGSNFKGWIFTILRNSFVTHYRKDILKNKAFNGGFNNFHLLIGKDMIYPSPDSFYSTREIHSAIDDLQDKYRIPFNLFLEGYSYKEIAEEMDLPLGTVKSHIFFSRKRLKKALQDWI